MTTFTVKRKYFSSIVLDEKSGKLLNGASAAAKPTTAGDSALLNALSTDFGGEIGTLKNYKPQAEIVGSVDPVRNFGSSKVNYGPKSQKVNVTSFKTGHSLGYQQGNQAGLKAGYNSGFKAGGTFGNAWKNTSKLGKAGVIGGAALLGGLAIKGLTSGKKKED